MEIAVPVNTSPKASFLPPEHRGALHVVKGRYHTLVLVARHNNLELVEVVDMAGKTVRYVLFEELNLNQARSYLLDGVTYEQALALLQSFSGSAADRVAA